MEEIDLLFFRMKRLMNINEPFEDRHRYLLDRLSHVGAPFGLKGVDLSSLNILIRRVCLNGMSMKDVLITEDQNLMNVISAG